MMFYTDLAQSYGKRFSKAVKSAGEGAMKTASDKVSHSKWNPFTGKGKPQVRTESHGQNEPQKTPVKTRPTQTSDKAEKKQALQTFKAKLSSLQKQFAASLTGSDENAASTALDAKELLRTAPGLLKGHASEKLLNGHIDRAQRDLETPQDMSEKGSQDVMTVPLEMAMDQLKGDMDTQEAKARQTLTAMAEVRHQRNYSSPRFTPLEDEVDFMQVRAEAELEEEQAMLQLERDAQATITRAEELRKLEHEIRDLNEIFKSMSQVVYDQGQQFETLESLIDSAAFSVQEGVKTLDTCVKVDKSNHKLVAAVAASLAVLGLVALALIIFV
ncbi:Qa-SNARE family protein [Endozoicomonas arenosclerae]|uniref:Qa-SNARE family protein n=1 Tax=Endozoicomonas arenosclerae TaxID=1633495 RepID=UPI00078375A7|nr:Qa-SNARE family protein [Endozoicomonas arenosclerae]